MATEQEIAELRDLVDGAPTTDDGADPLADLRMAQEPTEVPAPDTSIPAPAAEPTDDGIMSAIDDFLKLKPGEVPSTMVSRGANWLNRQMDIPLIKQIQEAFPGGEAARTVGRGALRAVEGLTADPIDTGLDAGGELVGGLAGAVPGALAGAPAGGVGAAPGAWGGSALGATVGGAIGRRYSAHLGRRTGSSDVLDPKRLTEDATSLVANTALPVVGGFVKRAGLKAMEKESAQALARNMWLPNAQSVTGRAVKKAVDSAAGWLRSQGKQLFEGGTKFDVRAGKVVGGIKGKSMTTDEMLEAAQRLLDTGGPGGKSLVGFKDRITVALDKVADTVNVMRQSVLHPTIDPRIKKQGSFTAIDTRDIKSVFVPALRELDRLKGTAAWETGTSKVYELVKDQFNRLMDGPKTFSALKNQYDGINKAFRAVADQMKMGDMSPDQANLLGPAVHAYESMQAMMARLQEKSLYRAFSQGDFAKLARNSKLTHKMIQGVNDAVHNTMGFIEGMRTHLSEVSRGGGRMARTQDSPQGAIPAFNKVEALTQGWQKLAGVTPDSWTASVKRKVGERIQDWALEGPSFLAKQGEQIASTLGSYRALALEIIGRKAILAPEFVHEDQPVSDLSAGNLIPRTLEAVEKNFNPIQDYLIGKLGEGGSQIVSELLQVLTGDDTKQGKEQKLGLLMSNIPEVRDVFEPGLSSEFGGKIHSMTDKVALAEQLEQSDLSLREQTRKYRDLWGKGKWTA